MFETSNNRFINPNRWEKDQLVSCKHHRRHSSLMLRVGLEPMTSKFQVRCYINHSALLPPIPQKDR